MSKHIKKTSSPIAKNYEDMIIPYVLIFMSSLNTFSYGATIWLFYTLWSLAGYFSCREKIIIYDAKVASACLVYSMAALFASLFYYELMEILKAVTLILTCLAAYCNYRRAINKKLYITRVLATVFSGYLSQTVLTLVYNWNFSIKGQRLLRSIWTNGYISVTLVSLFCSIVIGFSVFLIVARKKSREKLLGMVALLVVIIINIKTATRTPFLIIAITVVVALFYTLRQDLSSKKIINVMSVSLLVAVVLIIGWFADVGRVRTMYENSPIFVRFSTEGIQSSRGNISVNHFRSMFNYPFGGSYISKEYGHAHNILQESHDLYGIFAFLSVMVLLLSIVANYVKMIRSKVVDETRDALFLVYTAVIPELGLEPILAGYTVFFWIFVFIHALACAYLGAASE